MTDPNPAAQSILLIRTGTPAESDLSGAGLTQAQLEEQLSLVEAALGECGMGRITRIGDNALVATYPTADSAFGAACSVQQACKEFRYGSALADVRMLLDSPATDSTDAGAGDGGCGLRVPAERLMEQVPAGQIFATTEATGHLSELSSARFRLYEPEASGAGADNGLCQVICNEETITRIAIPTQHQENSVAARSLNLRWREHIMTVVPESPPLTIGRADQADIQIKSELASRIHARLAFQYSNFILTDQSTNGTFIQIDDDEEVYLHNEQIVLRGHGVIGLGRRIRAGRGKLIYFKLAS
jgi:adenylate cyclase